MIISDAVKFVAAPVVAEKFVTVTLLLVNPVSLTTFDDPFVVFSKPHEKPVLNDGKEITPDDPHADVPTLIWNPAVPLVCGSVNPEQNPEPIVGAVADHVGLTIAVVCVRFMPPEKVAPPEKVCAAENVSMTPSPAR